MPAEGGDLRQQGKGPQRPLSGIRVLDLGRHLAGPTAAMWLGDLGADVVKIEKPGGGDPGRSAGPPFLNGASAFFLSANRNKRSLALDLKQAAGRRLFLRLAGGADVLIENFRPGVMEALGIGYRSLQKINPCLIYCAISGFGADGPLAGRPGLDQIVQASSGFMSLTGSENGDPMRAGTPIADLLAGLFAAYGVLAALQARHNSGKGQRVETSLLEGMVAMLTFQGVRVLNGGGVPARAGNHHPILAPYGTFRASDGLITIGTTGEEGWRRLCRVLGAASLLKDPRFENNEKRVTNRRLLARRISERLQEAGVEEWEQRLNQAGIPASAVYALDQALEHPQVSARRMIEEVEHPQAGLVRLPGLPVKFSITAAGVDRPPPLLGEHSRELLREAGVEEAEWRQLQAAGVLDGGIDGE